MLEGGYCEAGESGRWHVKPGMLIVHAPGESHTDWFADRPTQLIDFSIYGELPAGVYRPCDADALMSSLRSKEGLAHSIGSLEPIGGEADWPDLLATDIRSDARLSLGDWADRHGLRRETVSRGFLRAYGVSPAAYRLGVRVKAVVAALNGNGESFADLAAKHGFSDQSHMNRAIRAMTGRTPTEIRNIKFVQDRAAIAV